MVKVNQQYQYIIFGIYSSSDTQIKKKAEKGLWSSLVGYQPRALGIVGSNPANPIQSLSIF